MLHKEIEEDTRLRRVCVYNCVIMSLFYLAFFIDWLLIEFVECSSTILWILTMTMCFKLLYAR